MDMSHKFYGSAGLLYSDEPIGESDETNISVVDLWS